VAAAFSKLVPSIPIRREVVAVFQVYSLPLLLPPKRGRCGLILDFRPVPFPRLLAPVIAIFLCRCLPFLFLCFFCCFFFFFVVCFLCIASTDFLPLQAPHSLYPHSLDSWASGLHFSLDVPFLVAIAGASLRVWCRPVFFSKAVRFRGFFWVTAPSFANFGRLLDKPSFSCWPGFFRSDRHF